MRVRKKFTHEDGATVLWNAIPKLFGAEFKALPGSPVDLSFEPEADRILEGVPMTGVTFVHLPAPVQRVLFEKIAMVISASMVVLSEPLHESFLSCPEDQLLSLLLSGEVRNMNLRSLRTH